MNTQTLPSHPATALAERLEGILASIARLIFGRVFFLGDLAARLHNRVGSVRRRLAALLAHLAAGTLPRQRAPRPGQSGGPPIPYVSRRSTWVITTFGHHAAGYASQLQFLLNDPATLATLAAAPPAAQKSASRILRPLCHILGVTLPPILQTSAPPARPRIPRPIRPRTPPPPRPAPPRPPPWAEPIAIPTGTDTAGYATSLDGLILAKPIF